MAFISDFFARAKRWPDFFNTAQKTPKTPRRNADNPAGVLVHIKRQPYSATKADLDRFRTAVAVAKNIDRPDRNPLLRIYDALLSDAKLVSTLNTRKLWTRSTAFVLRKPSGDADPEVKRLFAGPWFGEFIDHTLDSLFYGHSLVEITVDGDRAAVELVPREHVVPEFGEVKINPFDARGIPFREAEFRRTLVEIGKKDDLGLLAVAAPLAILKRLMLGNWSEFGEIFGMPLRIATTASRDPAELRQIDEMLERMGAAAFARLPHGTEIEIKESSRGDAFKVFAEFVRVCNNEITQLILGQTLSTDEAEHGTRAQAVVHQTTADDFYFSDRNLVADVVNDRLLPLLAENGWPVQNYRFEWDDAREIPLEKQWEIDRGLLAHFKIPHEYFTQKYGVPIDGPKDAAPAEPERRREPRGEGNFPPPRPSERAGGAWPNFTAIRSDADEDADDDELLEEFVAMARAVHEGKISTDALDAGFFLAHARILERAVFEGWGKEPVEIEYDAPDAVAVEYLRKNVFVFSGAKTFAQIAELREILLDSDGKLRLWEDFWESATEIHRDYNHNYLKAEYHFAVASSQMASLWADVEADKDALAFLVYDAVQDRRTRAEHAALDGVTLPVDSPFWNFYYPPNGWNCRCTVRRTATPEKISDETAAMKAGDAAINQPAFKNNVGKTRVIFKDGHPYFQKTNGNLTEMDAEKNYGMRSIERIYRDRSSLPARAPEPSTRADAETWFRNLPRDADKPAVLPAFGGRKIAFDDEGFAHILKKTEEERWRFVHNLPNVLSDPDEVWFGFHRGEKGENKYPGYKFIKYFRDAPIVVVVHETDGAWRVKTAYKAYGFSEKETKPIKDERRGLLVGRR